MGALDHMSHSGNKREYEPIFIRTYSNTTTSTTSSHLPRLYNGGFEQQKHKWTTVNQRSQRIRNISCAQILIGVLASWNYLWLSNLFACFVGITGILAFRSEKLSWTLVYLLVCMMEFIRNVLLAPHLYERFCIPQYHFTVYEYIQVALMVIQGGFLIPAAFVVVFSAAASAANPLW